MVGAVPRRRHVLPGFTLTLGVTLLYTALVILLPLAALVVQASGLGLDRFLAVATSDRALATYAVTVGAAAAATVFNGAFGLLLAWVLVRYRFPGRRLIDALVDLPFALPTAVAGLALTTLFAPNGWLGAPLAGLGVTVVFTWVGIAIAMAFTSLPFVVRTVQPVLEDIEIEVEEASASLGASRAQTFRRVIVPFIAPSFLAGIALAFARSLGEFGAVIFIAGNMPMKTEITALLIFIRLEEFNYGGAAAIATVLLLFAFVMLGVTNAIQAWQLRYVRR
jgi:sulfate transport system permease protein